MATSRGLVDSLTETSAIWIRCVSQPETCQETIDEMGQINTHESRARAFDLNSRCSKRSPSAAVCVTDHRVPTVLDTYAGSGRGPDI